MKWSYKTILCLSIMGMVTSSCDKQDFVEINKDPDALSTVPPENQLLNATIGLHGQDFEAFYDTYRRIMPWMQYNTELSGNVLGFTGNVDNFPQRYGRFYNGVGNALYDLEKLVERLPDTEQPKYVHMIRMARVLRSYYAFYVSDIFGSIPYSDAFQGRYGGTLTPKYDTQQELFNQLDADLKEAITTLKATQTAVQVSPAAYDQYFGGNATRWVKAANALRLKIATRLIKRDAAKARSIAQEVLATPADLMSSNADGWVFVGRFDFTSGGNWNPDGLRATKPMVDFMWNTRDPRIDAFFTPNRYSQANINALIAATPRQLPAGTTENPRRYVGSFTSPDESQNVANRRAFYTPRTVAISGQQVSVDTLSNIQPRLFQPAFNSGNGVGDGLSYLPVITYSDFCFMRAELAARTITSEPAKDWYDAGVTSSIQWFDEVARGSKIDNYTPLAAGEIAAYLARPEVAFNPAKAIDQIACQAYISYFNRVNEGWAIWKRTGFPNATSTLALPDMRSSGAILVVPRRAPLGLLVTSDPNYANKKSAYDAMAAIPGWGREPQDASGRVWWDQQ
ncbi:MAG: SusD/RagB family nutrient-binding outer membrane lipoprotein [Cytophagia bacterium]|nr:MAG: SusD/RagB family nutrient-binding outer membrane lipoprotein [Runella sp.]TAG18815.1 MAG: SusD/RagB family nutrient-binding outer membrane lipoprotein [Cytophagales bacterium]TAG39322.1 MAG: SusD/RagB family nutrient-binding outer membrane lipoprotein [Cytophagia bacterium]TAG79750.1 MAG: SusD/RagB family nutrient-binding outer membrane lipoprotein [Cytophagales bacterium]